MNKQSSAIDEPSSASDEPGSAMNKQSSAIDELSSAMNKQSSAIDEPSSASDEQSSSNDSEQHSSAVGSDSSDVDGSGDSDDVSAGEEFVALLNSDADEISEESASGESSVEEAFPLDNSATSVEGSKSEAGSGHEWLYQHVVTSQQKSGSSEHASQEVGDPSTHDSSEGSS